MSAADILAEFPFDTAFVVTSPTEIVASYGDADEIFCFASVTKMFAAVATLVAVERHMMGLDEPAEGPVPEGTTIRHLLAHTSGLPFEKGPAIGRPGAKRIYTNYGIEVLGENVERHTGQPFARWLDQTVLCPLEISTVLLDGSPAYAASGSANDLAAFGREMLRPTLISPQMHREATTVQFPGISGVLPGYGRQVENDWGLGFEIRGNKEPHWTGRSNSPRTFGHFGQCSSFLWVDPERDLAAAFLGAKKYSSLHHELWPRLNDAVLAEFA